MSSIDGNDGYNKTPILKINLSSKLLVGGILEGVNYIILEIKDSSIFTEESPPVVGETLMLDYSFSPYSGYYGYEHLNIIVFRCKNGNIRNYVQYFKNIESLEKFFSMIKLTPDKNFAIKEINKLTNTINGLKRNYGV